MSTVAVISWAAYLLGLSTSTAFLIAWLVGIQFWLPRRRDERRGVRRARQFILALSSALTLRYVTGIVSLVATGGHPSDAPPAVVGTVLGVVVQLWLLWLLFAGRNDGEDNEEQGNRS